MTEDKNIVEQIETLDWDTAPQEAVVTEVADIDDPNQHLADADGVIDLADVPVEAGTLEEFESDTIASEMVKPTDVAVRPMEQRSVMSSEDAMAHAAISIAGGLGGSQNQYEAAMKIMRGHELGIPPAAAVENIYVVNNKTSMGAGLIGAIIKKSGQYNYRVTEHDNDHCQIEFYEKDFLSQGEWINVGVSWFSMDDAKTAGLVKPKSPWLTYPRNMVLARALTNGARWYCPDVFHGSIYTPEELETVAVAAPVAAQQRISGAPAAPRGVAAPQSSASSYQAPPAPVSAASVEGMVYDRPQWADGVVWDSEECPVHFNDPSSLANATYKGQQNPVNFFKGGRMKEHAHNTGSEWCNRRDLIGSLRARVDAYSQGHEKQFNAFIDKDFADIAVVDPSDWRAGDWYAILEVLNASALEPVESESLAVDGDTGNQLPM